FQDVSRRACRGLSRQSNAKSKDRGRKLMSRSSLIPQIVLVCLILFGTVTASFSIGCPDCFFNYQPLNGPASDDGRRTISIKIDSSWGATTNEQIWNATQDAKNGWNGETDSNNNKVGYFLDVQQANSNPQIII